MSKMSAKVAHDRSEAKLHRVINFMGSSSFELNPLDTLRLVACSSIFGEPQYYRKNSKREESVTYALYDRYGSVVDSHYRDMTTTQVFEKVIDDALSYDFEGTLKFAVDLRKEFYMRLNPQVIMVRAALHPGREEFTKANPGKFHTYNKLVMKRADEPATQVTYYLYLTGDKKNMPSVLKRSIAKKLSELKPWQINKYKNAEIGMINTVRIVHANSPALDELMRTGTIAVKEDTQLTWEQLASSGMSWRKIADKQVETNFMGHMALLRNLRNIFTSFHGMEVQSDRDIAKVILKQLKDGTKDGKQFPFRYASAYEAIEKDNSIKFKSMILDALEECLDISIDNMPHLEGKTIALSDNSASAWGAFTSEYGKTTIAEIDNLSSVIAAMSSDEGEVGEFGNILKMHPVLKRNGVLSQARTISATKGSVVGGDTEGGIWHFFRDAIDKKLWYDNIFIFSDMQAGTGQLYGTYSDKMAYMSKGYGCTTTTYSKYGSMMARAFGSAGQGFIDVYKLIQKYRQTVNPKVNVFCVQTVGYTNTIMPVMSYRTAFLAGWTGKEVQFAAEYIKQWDNIEKRHNKKNDDQVISN